MILDIVDLQKNKYIEKRMFSLEQFNDIFENIELDLNFQRRGPWNQKHRDKYIESLLTGKAATNISIVDIESCLEYSIEKKNEESIKYYSELKNKGQKYVSIDGNNRSQTLNKLLKSEIPFPDISITFTQGGRPFELKGKRFNELEEKYQKKILTKLKVPFNIIKKTLRQELNESFLQVNEGKSVNEQEKRNAIEGVVSVKIRELGLKYKKLFEHFSMNEKNIKEKNHERILSMLLYSESTGGILKEYIGKSNHKDITLKSNLDNLFYQKLTQQDLKKFEKNTDFLMKVIKEIVDISNKKIKDNQFFSIYLLVETLKEKYNTKEKIKEIANYFIKMEDFLIGQKRTSENGKKIISKYSECNDRLKNNLECRKKLIEQYILKNTPNMKEKSFKTEKKEKKLKQKPKKEIKIKEEDLSTEKYMKIPPMSKSLSEFLEFEEEVFVDTSFQREPSWSKKQTQNYILSMLKGKDFTDIVVANVEECKKNTKDSYFDDIKPNKKYISIDGNNRTQAIKSFLNNEISLPTPITLIKDNGEQKTFDMKDEVYLKTLEENGDFENVLNSIKNIKINIIELLKSDKQEINNTFLMINEGVSVNKQEKRIAMGTEISKFIRKISTDNSDLFDYKNDKKNKKNLLLSETDWLKREDDAIFSKLLYLESNNSSLTMISDNNLDEMYIEGLDKETLDNFEKKINILLNILSFSEQKQYKTYQFIDLYVYISNILDNGYDIKKDNYESIYKQYRLDDKERDEKKYYFYNNKEMVEEEVSWSTLSKDLNNIEKLIEREKELYSYSYKYIETIDKTNILEDKIKEKILKVEKHIKDIETLDLDDLEIRKILEKIQKIFEIKNNKEKMFFIKKMLENNYLKEIIKGFDNNEISIDTKMIKKISKDKNINLKDIVKEIKSSKLSSKSISFLKRNLVKNTILHEKQKKLKTEANSWLIAFIENDFDLFKDIIEEEINNISDENKMYERINLRIFKKINERSIKVIKKEENYEIINPFEIRNNKVYYDMATKGVPDVIYFPINNNIKAVGFSTTTSSKIDWEDTQILRHPFNINQIKKELLKNGNILTEDLEKLKRNENIEMKNKVIEKLLPNESSNQQIEKIIQNLSNIEKEEDKQKLLDEYYGFNSDTKYYFYGDIQQSVKKISKKNQDKDLRENEITIAEKRTIDLFMFAQKNYLYKKIKGGNEVGDNNKHLLLNYISKNITNIIGDINENRDLEISTPEERLEDFEIINLLISDIDKTNIEETNYLKFQINESEDEKKLEWSNNVSETMIDEALELAITLFIKNNDIYSELFEDKYNQINNILLNINLKEPNSIIKLSEPVKDKINTYQKDNLHLLKEALEEYIENILNKEIRIILNNYIKSNNDFCQLYKLMNTLYSIKDINKLSKEEIEEIEEIKNLKLKTPKQNKTNKFIKK